jgi:hypothetical protein
LSSLRPTLSPSSIPAPTRSSESPAPAAAGTVVAAAGVLVAPRRGQGYGWGLCS